MGIAVKSLLAMYTLRELIPKDKNRRGVI